jgi:hypothetical protein
MPGRHPKERTKQIKFLCSLFLEGLNLSTNCCKCTFFLKFTYAGSVAKRPEEFIELGLARAGV